MNLLDEIAATEAKLEQLRRQAADTHEAPPSTNVTLHPAAVLAALDAEADAWAAETNLASTVNRMSEDPHTRDILNRFARQCFAEGAYRGAMRATSNKAQTIPITATSHPALFRACEIVSHDAGAQAGWSSHTVPAGDLAIIEAELAGLSPGDLETFCIGDEDERQDLMVQRPGLVPACELLNDFFDDHLPEGRP